jgi:hypothetical protein
MPNNRTRALAWHLLQRHRHCRSPGMNPSQWPLPSGTSAASSCTVKLLKSPTTHTAVALGAHVLKVAPPGTRFAPIGVSERTFCWEAGMAAPNFKEGAWSCPPPLIVG